MTTKRHIAEPNKLTLCGLPSTPRPFVSADQARILRDGQRSNLCRTCDRALASAEDTKAGGR